jgi:hypothetical protein
MLARKVDCPLPKWKVNSGQSSLHHKLEKRKLPPLPSPPPTHKKKRGGPFTHQMTSEEVLIGCMEIIILPLFLAWTKLIALPKNILT